jgi:exodeoxyribonuclease VII large subunit
MLRILKKRYPLTKVRLFPVRVQGVEAPDEIAAAIRYANNHQLADVLIVGRGGGSIEDLWAFNDERVAYAIYESKIPVISAVGHEPDVTISDYVADLRAATPSNAAELAVPDQDNIRQIMDSMSGAMVSALSRQLNSARRHLNILGHSPSLQSPVSYLHQRRKSLELLKNRMVSSQSKVLSLKRNQFIALTSKLDAMSPLKVLTRGYAMAERNDGTLIRSVTQAKPGDDVSVIFTDGHLIANITQVKENVHESSE